PSGADCRRNKSNDRRRDLEDLGPMSNAEPNDAMRTVVKWSLLGAAVAFVTVMLISGGQRTALRVTCGLMAAGAGAVTFALLCANFAKDEETNESHGH